MITEDYVSLEIAKLLKRKKFNEYCFTAYSTEIGNFITIGPIKNSEIDADKDHTYICTAPTHQMALKWLREMHNIHINGDWAYKNKPAETGDFSVEYYMNIMSPDKNLEHLTDYYPTYEEAIEAALKYCLKRLI